MYGYKYHFTLNNNQKKGYRKKSISFFYYEYIKLDRDKSTFKSHRDFSSEKEITFKHL